MLKPYNGYTRKEIHDHFDPSGPFIPGGGAWGMSGTIRILSTNDYVFLVNSANIYRYEDKIYSNGLVRWYSQSKMKFSDTRSRTLISHDESKSNIYLFWRTRNNGPFYYLGKLKYVEHDNTTEKPIRFLWEIIDFDPKEALSIPEIVFYNFETDAVIDPYVKGALRQQPVPPLLKTTKSKSKSRRKGVSASDFDHRNVDFEGEAKKNSRTGNAGEDKVVEIEKERLIAAGRPDLADKVEATRHKNNTANYDIKSFETDGTDRYIEVKTTTGSKSQAYYTSEAEVSFSEDHSDQYYLYRLYNFDMLTGNGDYYIRKGAINRGTFEAITNLCR